MKTTFQVPADTRTQHWKNPKTGVTTTFRPEGPVHLHGTRKNPWSWDADQDVLAARVFVGLNVGGDPRWTLDDLIPIVVEVRKSQGHDPDSSFMAQKGVYTSKVDRSAVVEDGAQVVIIDMDAVGQRAFEKEILNLCEQLCLRLEQEEVVVDIQRNGLSIRISGVKVV